MYANALVSFLMPLAASAAAIVQERAMPTQAFELYGYSDKFGGLPVYNDGGLAYLGDVSKSNNTDAAEVTFLASDESLLGSPNATTTSDGIASWSNQTYFLPTAGEPETQTGFLNSSSSSTELTDGFYFYGHTLLHRNAASGELESMWYAVQDAATGNYALMWNTTGNNDNAVTLRAIKPTTPTTGAPAFVTGNPIEHF